MGMKVNKILDRKIERNFIFITGNLSIPVNYFIKKIEKGIEEKDNKNYKTNLISSMTDYKYFREDKELIKLLLPMCDLMDKYNLNHNVKYHLRDAWGFKMGFSNYTIKHDHHPSFLSGAIMLNKHYQSLYFPEINEELKSEPGNFALFSSFLKHHNERNIDDKIRYGLSFNLGYNTI
tara:strand:- start:43 stop:573 length:531 start_codon:yes stop_codon:yes gene_type:complete